MCQKEVDYGREECNNEVGIEGNERPLTEVDQNLRRACVDTACDQPNREIECDNSTIEKVDPLSLHRVGEPLQM